MQTPLSGRERFDLWIRLAIRGILIALGLFLFLRFASPLCSLFAPFLLALVVAWALHPLVRFLHNKLGISRKVITLTVILLCFAVLGGILYGALYMLVTEVRSLVDNWASIRQSLVDVFYTLLGYFNTVSDLLPDTLFPSAGELIPRLMNGLQSLLPSALSISLDSAGNFVSRLPSFFIASVVFLMASYFITADYPRLRFLATDRLPPSVHRFGSDFRRIFREAFGGYIKSQFILSSGVFCILALGFSVIRQPYGLVLAILLAVLDFIPILGSGTVLVPWTVISLCLGNFRNAIELLVIWGIIVLFRRLAEPKVLGEQTGLSPILSLVGIYVGMKAGGVWGMVFGPLILLVVLNLWHLGTFDPIWSDIKLCAADLSAILLQSRRSKD